MPRMRGGNETAALFTFIVIGIGFAISLYFWIRPVDERAKIAAIVCTVLFGITLVYPILDKGGIAIKDTWD
jgi:hypothetical protein